MNGLLPIVGAGGTFAGFAVAGLLAGILTASKTGQPMWTLGGLLAGLALGGYSAVRMLVRLK